MKKKIKEINGMLAFPLAASILLFGGFYTYSILALGTLISILLCIKIHKTKKSQTEKGFYFYGIVLLCVLSLISIWGAIDKGMAWYGFLRNLVFAVWVYYLMQFTKEEKETIFPLIPYAGVAMVFVGCISYFLPGLKEVFWQANRFGGIFQYSNTSALFLLVGIIILSQQDTMGKLEIALLGILSGGIFLTGSRGGLLLLFLVFGWLIVTKKTFRKIGSILLGVLVTSGLAYGLISGDFQNVARIFTLTKIPATLLERMLYLIDGLPLVLKYPLGMGYMGYASVQPEIQTGIYTTLFVHNEWLQMALDYGILFMLICLFLVGKQIIKGKQEMWKKVVIVLICGYSLLEFHFQYLSILMIVSLFWEFDEKKMKEQKKATVLENQIFAGAAALIFAYFGIASWMTFSGNVEQALFIYPMDTQALEAVMVKESDKNTAVMMAENLLELNAYHTQAYNTLAYAAYLDGKFEEALSYKMRILEIERFNMEEYADFVNLNQSILLSPNIDSAIIELCEMTMNDMEMLLQETEQKVNPIAYELREIPTFTWE